MILRPPKQTDSLHSVTILLNLQEQNSFTTFTVFLDLVTSIIEKAPIVLFKRVLMERLINMQVVRLLLKIECEIF